MAPLVTPAHTPVHWMQDGYQMQLLSGGRIVVRLLY